MKKAENGDGCVYLLPNGKWRAYVTITGTTKRVSRTCATEREAEKARRELLRLREASRLVITNRQTVTGYLEHWLMTIKRHEIRPHTLESYTSRVKHIMRHLGGVRLDALKPTHGDTLKSALLDEGLQPSTVNAVLRLFKTALNDAVDREILGVNPLRRVRRTLEPAPHRPILPMTAVEPLLRESAGTEWCALWHVLIGMGLRIGEALALTWDDYRDGRLHITKTVTQGRDKGPGQFIGPPKTKSSNRVLLVPEPVAAALKAHRPIILGIQIGTKGWVDHNLIFPGRQGWLRSTSTVSQHLNRDLKVAGAPEMTTRFLRHSCATYLVAQGTPIEVVQKILGHSSIAITADVYAQIAESLHEDAARRMGAFMKGGA